MNQSGKGRRALIADDEKSVARFVEINLDHAGYEVTTVHDGREALVALETGTFDVVVLDVMMPYVDGFEVLRSLRADKRHETTWVVMLTVKDTDADITQGLIRGADVYLGKPIVASDLLRCLPE